MGVVKVNIGDDLELVKLLLITLSSGVCIPVGVCCFTSSLDWIAGHWLEERSRVWVVDHGHVLETGLKGLQSSIYLVLGVNGLLRVESGANHLLEARVSSLVSKELESGLDELLAPAVFVGRIKHARDKVIEGLRSDCTIFEVDSGSRGGVSSLDDVRVLHSHPSG